MYFTTTTAAIINTLHYWLEQRMQSTALNFHTFLIFFPQRILRDKSGTKFDIKRMGDGGTLSNAAHRSQNILAGIETAKIFSGSQESRFLAVPVLDKAVLRPEN